MIGHRSLVVFVSQWGGYLILMACSVLVARILGPENVGRMAFCFGVIGILFMFTSLGFAQAHQKRLAEGQDPAVCYGTFLSILLALNVVIFLGGLLLFPIVQPTLGEGPAHLAFVLFLLYQSLNSLGQVFTNGLYGQERFVKAGLATLAARLARLAAIGAILFKWPNLATLAFCFVIDGTVFLLFGIIFSGVAKNIKLPTRESLESYWKYAKPLMITSPLGVLSENLDRVTLGSRYSVEAVGYYNVALNMFEAIKSLPSAVVSVAFPRMASAFAEEGAEGLRRVFNGFQRRLLLIATPVTVLGLLWSTDVIVLLFGPRFHSAGPALKVFFLVFWLVCFANPYHYVLYATEKHHLFIWLSPLAGALYFVSLLGLCRPELGLGAVGAAISVGVMPLISLPFVLHQTRRLYGIIIGKAVGLYALAGFLMFVVAAVFSSLMPGIAFRILWSLLAAAAYVFILILFKEIDRNDMKYFSFLASPRNFILFLRSSLV